MRCERMFHGTVVPLLALLFAAGSGVARATTTDLNVTLIERTPRYSYSAFKNNPYPGDVVTFHGHVRLWGETNVPEADYAWSIDGVEVGGGTLADLAPGDERIVTLDWTWTTGNHDVKLEVDPDNLITERSEVNNAIEDRINGLIVGFWVEQSVYDYFQAHQYKLGIGSNSWEDWAQRQMAEWNRLCENAIWPISPQGVLDRVRIDKIVIVDDRALPLQGWGLPGNHPDTSDTSVDLMWGFHVGLLDGDMYTNHTNLGPANHFYIERSLIHELGHARYLIDCYGFDVSHTPELPTVLIEEDGQPIAGSAYMPFVAWGKVLYYNTSGGVMSGPYGWQWSPYEAAAMNLIAGQRAVCGNYNSPCNIGAFLEDLPERNHFRFVDETGRPRRGAEVRVYRSTAGEGWYGKTFDNTPDLMSKADNTGDIHLGRNPFTDGEVKHTYGIANTVMVLRIEHAEQVWYRFQEISDFHMAYWQGHTQDAYYTIELPGPNEGRPGDFDGDRDVDQQDFGHFQRCLAGPGNEPSGACDFADLDEDNDVDQDDRTLFEGCRTGAAITSDPDCLL